MEHRITQYPLEQGALEIEYIEEFFGEYKRRKTSSEILGRLQNRDHLILMAMAPLPDDPGAVVPVSYKVAHEIRANEEIPKLADLVQRLRDHVNFDVAASSTPGLAAPAATGAARATSARSPSSRKRGRSTTASTRSS